MANRSNNRGEPATETGAVSSGFPCLFGQRSAASSRWSASMTWAILTGLDGLPLQSLTWAMWPRPPRKKPSAIQRQRRNACSDHAEPPLSFSERLLDAACLTPVAVGAPGVLLTHSPSAGSVPFSPTSAATDPPPRSTLFIPLACLTSMGNPSISQLPSPQARLRSSDPRAAGWSAAAGAVISPCAWGKAAAPGVAELPPSSRTAARP